MRFFLIWFWAAIPIWMAIQVPLQSGDYSWLPAYIISGAAAPIAFWCASVIDHPGWKVLALAVGLLTAGWNITASIGSSSSHRQAQTAPDLERIARRESMLRRDTQLAEQIAKIGWRLNGDTTFSIAGGIAKLKTKPHYISTGGCANLRARDPDGVCAKLAEEEGRLKEAGRVEEMEAERERIRLDLLKVEGPKTADAQADTIQRLLASFMTVDTAMVVALLNGIGPLIMELAGTLMPMLLDRALSRRNESGTGEDERMRGWSSSHPPHILPHNLENSLSGAVEDDPPILPASSPEASFELWLGEHVEDGGEDGLRARLIFQHCCQWCEKREVPAPNEREFSNLMAGRGYSKQKLRGVMTYVGIRLKSSKLKVVK